MSDNINVNYANSGFSTILLVIFIVLKLAGIIHWSWWWVLSPLWIGLGVVIAVFIVTAIIVAVAAAIVSRR